jgi:hypothetical protein
VLQQHRVAHARLAVEGRRADLYELQAKRDADDVDVFTLSLVEGRLFEAESDLIDQVAGLKGAEVRLLRAQGALGEECGFVPQLCREGCCNGHCTRCQAPTCTCEQPCRCEKCCQD